MVASWERPPAPSAAAVWLAPPDWTKPDDRPASRFDAPIAIRSRLGSTRYPCFTASARATPTASALTISTPSAGATSATRSDAPTSGIAGSGSASGISPTTATPWEERSRSAERRIATASTSSVEGTAGAMRLPPSSTATEPSPTASVAPWTSPSSPSTSASAGKKFPSPGSTPSRLGSCASAITRPSPNRKPVITGLETKSAMTPSRSAPAPTSTTAAISASAADRAANCAASPPASGPTAAADTAAVAVVALTTSWRDVPSRA